MEQITIYPDKQLLKKIEERAKREKRSINNLVLLILEKEMFRSQ
jgi:hypothetical protein